MERRSSAVQIFRGESYYTYRPSDAVAARKPTCGSIIPPHGSYLRGSQRHLVWSDSLSLSHPPLGSEGSVVRTPGAGCCKNRYLQLLAYNSYSVATGHVGNSWVHRASVHQLGHTLFPTHAHTHELSCRSVHAYATPIFSSGALCWRHNFHDVTASLRTPSSHVKGKDTHGTTGPSSVPTSQRVAR